MRKIGKILGFCAVAASLGGCMPMMELGQPGGSFRLNATCPTPFARTKSTPMYVAHQRTANIQSRLMMGNNAGPAMRQAHARHLATGECY